MKFLPGTDPKIVEDALKQWETKAQLPELPPKVPTDYAGMGKGLTPKEQLQLEREKYKKELATREANGDGWEVNTSQRDDYSHRQRDRLDLQQNQDQFRTLPIPKTFVQPTTSQKFSDAMTSLPGFQRPANQSQQIQEQSKSFGTELTNSVSQQSQQLLGQQDLTIKAGKSFIPGSNASGVRMTQSQAAQSGAGLTGTDQFKRKNLRR